MTAMDLADIIVKDGVRACVSVGGKKDLLETMARLLAPHADCSDGRIFDVLIERERLGSTGTGKGIAIPHGRLEGITRIMGAFVTLEKAVDFASADGEDVNLVMALIAPVDAGGDHLNALSLVSRFFRDGERCASLRDAADDAAVQKIIAAFDSA